MNPHSQIKREARIIGIDTCNNRSVIAAVYRGGSILDGVISGSKTEDIEAIVRRSRYYPELQFVMTHDPKHHLKIKSAQQSWAGLPLIECAKARESRSRRGFKRFAREGETIYVRSQMVPSRVSELIRLSWPGGGLPEPLRVAHLIAFHDKE